MRSLRRLQPDQFSPQLGSRTEERETFTRGINPTLPTIHKVLHAVGLRPQAGGGVKATVEFYLHLFVGMAYNGGACMDSNILT